MEAVQTIMAIFTPYMDRLNMYSMMFLAFMLLIFILVFVLGILLWKKKFVGGFLIFMACLIPFSAPFLLKLLSKNVLFPVETHLSARTLSYSPTFLITGSMTPVGKIPIKGCVMTTTLMRQSDSPKGRILSFLKPILVDKKNIDGPFYAHEALNVQHAINNIDTEVLADIDISCY